MRNYTTVCNPGWNTAVCTSSAFAGARIEPFKGFFMGRARHAGCYGRMFPDSDSAWQWLEEHGFSQRYYSRPYAFISLHLSPRTRKHLKSKPAGERWNILAKLLGKDADREYFKVMREASYMSDRRENWEAYMAGNWQVWRNAQ